MGADLSTNVPPPNGTVPCSATVVTTDQDIKAPVVDDERKIRSHIMSNNNN